MAVRSRHSVVTWREAGSRLTAETSSSATWSSRSRPRTSKKLLLTAVQPGSGVSPGGATLARAVAVSLKYAWLRVPTRRYAAARSSSGTAA